MIKIIKRGTRKVTTCEECGCEFAYDEEDTHYDNDALVVTCPQCETNLILRWTY